MTNVLVFEDGELIENLKSEYLWCGMYSVAKNQGSIVKCTQSCLPKNSVCVIPQSDGNILITTVESNTNCNTIEYCWEYAKRNNKLFILGTLAQVEVTPNINYLYLPLDDTFFQYGISNTFDKDNLIPWESRSSMLCWRGSCSGSGIREKFVKMIYDYNKNTEVRFSRQWFEGKNIPNEHFANAHTDRVNCMEFTKFKIFFIVDGNVISSSHMYAFAIGCVPMLISNGKCWFSDKIIPYIHYVPVNYDLSNLIEQIEWVQNNDNKAKEIANNALHFAHTYFSSESQQQYIKDSIEKLK